MVAPAKAKASSRSMSLERLLGHETQILKIEDRLVSVWTSFQVERLALYRELGILPYDDWNSFFKVLSAR